jgi:hypothetical protein
VLRVRVVENPHGLHLNAFKFRRMRADYVHDPQTGQMTSLVRVTSSLIVYLWMQVAFRQ